MKKQNPVRILTSQVMKSPSARQAMMKLMEQGRRDGWTRSQYVTAIRDEVVSPLAKRIYRDIDGPDPFDDATVTKAGARLFRQLVTVESEDVRGFSPIMEPWTISPTATVNEARMREVGLLKSHRDERRRAYEAKLKGEEAKKAAADEAAKRRMDEVKRHTDALKEAMRRAAEDRKRGEEERAKEEARKARKAAGRKKP